MSETSIRKIQQKDNPEIARVIRSILIEHNVPKVGTAYADPELDFLFETYDVPNAIYFVVEQEGKIIGGAGISQLANENETVCELQKMYFLPETRKKGIGAEMMELCLQSAKNFGFEKCYLETMPFMIDAQKLYSRSGFEPISAPMGSTGHVSCPVWMLKDLAL